MKIIIFGLLVTATISSIQCQTPKAPPVPTPGGAGSSFEAGTQKNPQTATLQGTQAVMPADNVAIPSSAGRAS